MSVQSRPLADALGVVPVRVVKEDGIHDARGNQFPLARRDLNAILRIGNSRLSFLPSILHATRKLNYVVVSTALH